MTYAEKIERGGPPPRPRARRPTELARTVRALTPHIGAWVEPAAASALGVRAARRGSRHRPVAAGRAAAADGRRLLLGTADGALELVEVQPPGGRPMPAQAYLRRGRT